MIAEYVEKSRVGKDGFFFIKGLIPVAEQVLADPEFTRLEDPGVLEHFGKIAFHGRCDGGRCAGHEIGRAQARKCRRDPINVFSLPVVPVIAVLVDRIQQDIQTAKRAGSQANNIDKAEGPVLQQESESGREIALEHTRVFVVQMISPGILNQEDAGFINYYKSMY